MILTIDLDNKDALLVRHYAEQKNISLSQLVREMLTKHIEDEYDLITYKKAKEEYIKDPRTFSHNEVKTMLGLH